MRRLGVFGSLQFARDEPLVNDHLGRDVRQFTSLPGFHLLSYRLTVPLHAINANRNAVDEPERFECFASTGMNTPVTISPNSSGPEV